MLNEIVLIDGTIAAQLIRRNPRGKSLVMVGKTPAWIENERLSTPASHLQPNDSAAIRRAYAKVGKR